MIEDSERCVRAVASRDARFDGWLYVGVTSTGIYCRPSCPARTPRRENLRFYASAGAAQAAGFRACLRCRPDAAPGSPEWSARTDLAARAMRLIGDGVIEREGVDGVARRLHVSPRHLHRVLVAEVGCGPLALARAERARTARILIESSDLPFGRVAFAAGFGSLRQFNDTMRSMLGRTPTELRERASRVAGESGVLSLRLAVRRPFDADGLLGFLRLRAIPGVEEVVGSTYRRSLRLAHGTATLALRPHETGARLDLRLEDLRDLASAVGRCRRLLDLDADPTAIRDVLGRDPRLARLQALAPGTRCPSTVDPVEAAVRVVVGQQVSVDAARTVLGRMAAELGEPLPEADGGLVRRFPDAATLAQVDASRLPMPGRRAQALAGLAQALADGALVLDGGTDRERARAQLLALPGVGPWSAEMIAMRALGDPDALPDSDLGLRRAWHSLGGPGALGDDARPWRPWRSYAAQLLWHASSTRADSRERTPAGGARMAA